MIDFTPYFPALTFIGVLVFGSAIVYTQWKQGANKVIADGTKAAAEVIQVYKDQVQQLRDENASLRTDIGKLQTDFASMRTLNEEKDKKINDLTLLLTGKNPDQEQYMVEMRALAAAATAFIKRSDEREGVIVKLLENK